MHGMGWHRSALRDGRGNPKSYSLSRLGEIGARETAGELSFVQISDSHMGFSKPLIPMLPGR